MDTKAFFKPTASNMIKVGLAFLVIICFDIFIIRHGEGTILQRFTSAYTNTTHVIFVVVILVIAYVIACANDNLYMKLKKPKA